ncbi:TlpA family protein disulfide reductase [Pedobacter frigidisoli]|nr:redoxin family protein [Pedobacter frigidisoli]
MKYILALVLVLNCIYTKAQDSTKVTRTVSGVISMRADMIPKPDTNQVLYDEKGKALRYYQYNKILSTGLYTIKLSEDKSLPRKQVITKLSEEQLNKYNTLIRENTKIKNQYVYETKKLDAAPLTAFYEQDKLDNKVIVQIFWYANCSTCTDFFAELSEFFKSLGDPKDLLVLLVTNDNQDVAKKKLKEMPLRNAELISSGKAIADAYQITGYPAYIVSDKNYVIKYAVAGFSRLAIPDLKTAIKTSLGR